jgi:predicted dehydrogenase
MDQVRIGIIGVGGMGTHHLGYLVKGEVANARLTAVCDTDPARVKDALARAGEGVQGFENADELFAAECCDAIILATPHYFHPPLAIKGFENGLHVLSEKPAGVYTKQVREMNEAAAAHPDCVFALMFNQRTRIVHQRMKELMDLGELGELRRVNWLITNWFRAQSYYDSGGWRATWAGEGGGVLINQCPHNLDLLQWICGMPKRMRAFCYFGKYHDIEVEDDVTAYFEYGSGATGLFITTTGEAPGTNRFEISGDRGQLVLEDGKLTFHRTLQPVSRFLTEYKGGFGAPECWKIDVPVKGEAGEHILITRNWIDAILHGKPLLARGEEGINSLQLSNAMHLSAWTDAWVDIPVDEDLYFSTLQEKIRASTHDKAAAGEALKVDGTF